VYAIQTTYLELIPITSCLHNFFHDQNFDVENFSFFFVCFFVLLVSSFFPCPCIVHGQCPATAKYNLICTLKLCTLNYCSLAEFFLQNPRLSILSLQGDTPTFRFKVLYHFWQGLVAYINYWLANGCRN